MTVATDIERFFTFFKRRVQHARSLCTPGEKYTPTEPDLHVLVSAGLDALSLYWAKTFRPALTKNRQEVYRMGEFLVRHGDGRIFCKCSAPNLLDRAIKENAALVPLVRKYLDDDSESGLVRFWHEDPDFEQVVRDFRGAKGAETAWLQRSRYGELLYREYRCMWVHQFQWSLKLADPYDPDEPEPRYQNKYVLDSKREAMCHVQLPMFSRAFILNTYEAVVTSFENECVASGTAPVID